MSSRFHWIVNWVTQQPAKSTIRRLLASALAIHPEAELPRYVPASKTFLQATRSSSPVTANSKAKAFAGMRKVVLFASCTVNFNNPDVGHAARAVLAHNGIEVAVEYPMCCGMPQFEAGKVQEVAKRSEQIATRFRKYLDEGYDVVTSTASCALMLKKEWPLLSPDNTDVKFLAERTYEVSEYLMLVHKRFGLEEIPEQQEKISVTLHQACHNRAQASHELLKLIPGADIHSVEQCSGHGGSFGVQKDGFNSAMKVGKKAFTAALHNLEETQSGRTHYVASDCPLAQDHIVRGMKETKRDSPQLERKLGQVEAKSPLELVAQAYKLAYKH